MYLTVNDIRLFFDVAGPGLRPRDGVVAEVPTLLLLHGGPGADHTAIKADLLPLAEHYQLVWIDHRGNGRSESGDTARWRLEQWADDVRAFCDALGIVKPVVLGQSFGGVVAQAYASRHPDKLVLSSIGARWDFELAMRRFASRGGAEAERVARAFWSRMTPDDVAAYRRTCFPLYVSKPATTDLRAMVVTREDVMRHFLRPGGPFQTMDLRPALSAIACPTLVLAGRDDPVIPWELSREVADTIAATSRAPVEFVCMDGCGHGTWRDEPEAARAVLRRFVDGACAP